MLFPDSFIDDLKQRLSLSKVISSRVKLQRKGQHYLGLCPFHNEKTPSFTVQDHKGTYYCFGCHAHGDIIEFISKVDQLSFADTIAYLANLAGVALPKLNPTEQKKIEHQHSLTQVTAKASEWFEKQLKLSTNHNAYDYLIKRGISNEDIQIFSLGYAPAKGLLNFLNSAGFSLDSIVDAGLAIKSESNNKYIERFCNRIIFPIKNNKNQIVGFGGRTLNAEVMPKYLNSPETVLFKKNNLFYAADIAFKHVLKKERVIVVEGYMDAIFMHKAGLPETVAALGTAFNQTHLKNLWKMANEPILCFDGDEAGKKAMLKAALTALPLLEPGLSLKFCFLPKGQDPDEVINQQGSAYIHQLLENNTNLADFIWQSEMELSNHDSPEGKALFEHKINNLVAQIQNTVVRPHYQQFMKNKLWQEFSSFKTEKQKKIINLKQAPASLPNNLPAKERLEYSLFAQLISYPYLVEDKLIFDDFFNLEIDHQELENLRSILVTYHENQEICLNNLLIQNNLGRLVEFLCGSKSSFIDTISTIDIKTAKEIWLITYKKYLLELLKTEYNQFMQRVHYESKAFEKATELKKSIDLLIKEITEKEANLSPEQI